ncbi:hypothetical protein [Neobacillus cucumis]|nr:hypothetical protein [Neobacillus cucumis]MDR4947048.1 hypothetical protein [Neobacillus cucumis]
MKSQRIPEHKLNTTTTAGQVIEENANKESSMQSPSDNIILI